jgi:beta-glucanase (GH16 family)
MLNQVNRLPLPSLALVLIALSGCQATTVADAQRDVVYPAPNRSDDRYDPGPGWTLAWSDEFDGDALDPGKWVRQVVPAGRFNDEWQRYTASPDNAYVEDGCLVIKAMHEGGTHGPDRYTSARLHTIPAHGWRYGRIAARIQLPFGRGIWPAFWMLGANIDENGGNTPWPQSGEIDILELYGSRDNGRVEANIHYADRNNRHANMGAKGYELDDGWFADAFHVFEIVWDEERIEWFVDGERFASTTITGAAFEEFHRPFFILLNIAVGGRAAGPVDDSTAFPKVMYVDWVRVYQ